MWHGAPPLPRGMALHNAWRLHALQSSLLLLFVGPAIRAFRAEVRLLDDALVHVLHQAAILVELNLLGRVPGITERADSSGHLLEVLILLQPLRQARQLDLRQLQLWQLWPASKRRHGRACEAELSSRHSGRTHGRGNTGRGFSEARRQALFALLDAQLQSNRRGCTPPRRRWREARAAYTCGSYRLKRLRTSREPSHEDAATQHVEGRSGVSQSGVSKRCLQEGGKKDCSTVVP